MGQGKQGEELVQILGAQFQEVIGGLQEFWEFTAEDLKSALTTALNETGLTPEARNAASH